MNYGTSLVTILELFRLNNIRTKNLYFYYLTGNDELPLLFNKIQKIGILDIKKIKFNKDILIDPYFINSENSNSRCAPKYSNSSWTQPPSDVYVDGMTKNYYNCNMHTLLFYLIHKCFYENFFINRYNDPELMDNDKLLTSSINGFYHDLLNYNYLEGLNIDN
jgi:hypothetical protein